MAAGVGCFSSLRLQQPSSWGSPPTAVGRTLLSAFSSPLNNLPASSPCLELSDFLKNTFRQCEHKTNPGGAQEEMPCCSPSPLSRLRYFGAINTEPTQSGPHDAAVEGAAYQVCPSNTFCVKVFTVLPPSWYRKIILSDLNIPSNCIFFLASSHISLSFLFTHFHRVSNYFRTPAVLGLALLDNSGSFCNTEQKYYGYVQTQGGLREGRRAEPGWAAASTAAMLKPHSTTANMGSLRIRRL